MKYEFYNVTFTLSGSDLISFNVACSYRDIYAFIGFAILEGLVPPGYFPINFVPLDEPYKDFFYLRDRKNTNSCSFVKYKKGGFYERQIKDE